LAVDRDFILPEYYNSLASISFLNQGFFYPTLPFNVWDVPIFPPGYHALNSTPYGAPGVLLRLDPNEKFYVQAAVYDGYPDRIGGGARVNLNEAEGALAYFELGIRRNQGKNDEGLRGNYKLGGYYHTDEFLDVYDAVRATFSGSGTIEEHSGNFGVYALVDHELHQEIGRDDPARQGLVGFLRAAGAPSKQNLTELEFSGGLVYKGLIPGRDWDTVGLAGSYLQISDDVSDAYASLGLPEPDFEGVVEASYRAQLTAWWTLQTSLQYIIHPGGKTDPIQDPDNAVVLLFQSAFRF
jgi:porin